MQTATINDIAGFFEIDRDLAKVVSSSDCKSFQELQAVPGLELAVIYKASEKCSIVYDSAAICKSENSATQTSYSSLESRFDKLEVAYYHYERLHSSVLSSQMICQLTRALIITS